MTYELPEPSFKLTWKFGGYYVSEPEIGNTDCYTAEQMRADYDKGLDDAAKVCRSHVLRTLTREEAASQAQGNATAYDCENSILAMKGAP